MTSERLDILDFFGRYCFAIDHHDLAGVEECFVEAATFRIDAPDPVVAGVRSGRKPIAAFMSSTWADQVEQPRHIIVNVVFDAITADEAEVRAYLVLTFTGLEASRVAATGWYHTFLVREPDGVWRIRTHELGLDPSRLA